MSHIMYVGGVGMGKTALAVYACQQDHGDNVFSNIPLNQEYFPNPDRKGTFKNIIEWIALDDLEHATCGVWFMDEADMWLDSRKFSSLNDVARRKLKEHRKDDIRIISTTQHVSFVDRVFRILCDEVRVVSRRSWPFIGWIWPSCVRPDMNCPHCGRMRPDGMGDRHYWWQRWLGMGTVYTWDVYPASILGASEDASGKDLEREEEESVDEEGNPTRPSKRLGHGHKLFNMSFAGAYDTSAKASQAAHEAHMAEERKELERENARRDRLAQLSAERAAKRKEAKISEKNKAFDKPVDTVDNP